MRKLTRDQAVTVLLAAGVAHDDALDAVGRAQGALPDYWDDDPARRTVVFAGFARHGRYAVGAYYEFPVSPMTDCNELWGNLPFGEPDWYTVD